MGAKIYYLQIITYYYFDNKNSITRKNNRLYKFTGLEGYAYIMEWAIKIAIEKKGNKYGISQCIYGVLVSMYYYYLDLYNKYDVSKILKWCFELKLLNNIYEKNIPNYIKKQIIEVQKKEYSDINEIITFHEFLDKIKYIKLTDMSEKQNKHIII